MATTTPDPAARNTIHPSADSKPNDPGGIGQLTRAEAVGLIVLSLWSSTAWLLADLFPARMPTAAARGSHLFLIGMAALPWGLKRTSWPSIRTLWRTAALSLALIAFPSLLLDAVRGKIPSSTAVLIFALLPAALALVSLRGAQSLLAPALAAIAGLLLVLPVSVPSTGIAAQAIALLILAATLTGAAMFGLRRQLRGIRFAPALAILCLTNAAALLLISTVSGHTNWTLAAVRAESLRCLSADLPETLLLTWLLSRLAPHSLAARYLLTPFFTVLEGLILLHPPISPWMMAGTALLGGATYRLLTVVPHDEPLSIRP